MSDFLCCDFHEESEMKGDVFCIFYLSWANSFYGL